MLLGTLISACVSAYALNPSLDISQYAHTSWTVRDGLFNGHVYSVAQTADGYLWFGAELGLFRFDGVRSILMKPPQGPELTEKVIFRVLGARDGTLWIGMFNGLVSWSGGKLTRYPELDGQVVGSLIEDREGTVWAGTWAGGAPPGRLCAMRNGKAQCYGVADSIFGGRVSSLYEDRDGNLWAGAESGIFRWKPGPPKRVPISLPSAELTGLTTAADGKLIGAVYGAGLIALAGNKAESYRIPSSLHPNVPLTSREVNANKLLRDRDGGLWIGTVDRGLIHVHNGRTDVFTRSDGLSGNVVLSLFEDREGNVWVTTTGGLDRFRELPVTTINVKQGLSSDAVGSVLASADGSVWIGGDGLTRWKNGQTTVFRQSSGLPGDNIQSLFEDHSGRIWAFTDHRASYLRDGRFVAATVLPGAGTYCVTQDKTGDMWLSQHEGLLRLRDGRVAEQIPWAELGRDQQAKVVLADPAGDGLWLGFWNRGGVLYFKDRKVRASYAARDGLGAGHVADLRLDAGGALWVATENGGLSRIKGGRIATLTSKNGLPCDTIHWSIEDGDRWMWLYTGCGLVRISRAAVDAWIADPAQPVETTLWDAADGVQPRGVAASPYAPRVAKAGNGTLWFLTGLEGVQMVDPRHLRVNTIAPAVHIEEVRVNGKPYDTRNGRLPANLRDLSVRYTAPSLEAPDKVRFRYMLEGQDPGWKEVINDREAQYSNLRPRKYRFRVIASNNSGVWNQTGDTLEFFVEPRVYQTWWFAALCTAALLAGFWGAYRLRLRRLAREFNARIEARLDERTRVARELHDTLLQSFQGLMFSFQAARNLLPARAEEAIRTLDEAIRSGDEAIAEGREAIQGLRADPLQTDLQHLLTVTGKEVARVAGAEGGKTDFRVIVEGSARPVAPLVQDEIHRIAREILRNAFHHACASRIEAEITYDGHFFRLRIRDNGGGIDRKVLEQGARSGHWGLPGIRERAKQIGAQFRLWSERGAGTEAELTIPARIAYRPAPNQRKDAAGS